MSDDALTCDQLVSAADDCCAPEERCGQTAAFTHADSGLSLCTEHDANAREWTMGGVWRVGTTEVSYPDGWTALDAPDQNDAPQLEAVRLSDEPGLVIETFDRGEA